MAKPPIARFGIWTNIYAYSYQQQIELARKAEQYGYGALWAPDMIARDPFVSLALLARETDRLFLASGIANIYSRNPLAMAAARASMADLSAGRFILGLGISHPELVAGVLHIDYKKPLATMREYLGHVLSPELGGMESLAGAPPSDMGFVVLAALGDKMLALSAEKTDGAHPYLTTPEHTARAREILGPDAFLAPEQKVVLETDATTARAVARQHLAMYLGLRNYRNNWLRLGFEEKDFEDGGSNRLVDALVAWGNEDKILKHLEGHLDSGADHVAIQALRPDGQAGFDENALKAFAPG